MAKKSRTGMPVIILHSFFRRNKLQKIADIAFQHCAEPCQHVNVQAGDPVVAVVVQLCPLHLSPLTELVFADALLFDHTCKIDTNCAKPIHAHPSDKLLDMDSLPLIDLD